VSDDAKVFDGECSFVWLCLQGVFLLALVAIIAGSNAYPTGEEETAPVVAADVPQPEALGTAESGWGWGGYGRRYGGWGGYRGYGGWGGYGGGYGGWGGYGRGYGGWGKGWGYWG